MSDPLGYGNPVDPWGDPGPSQPAPSSSSPVGSWGDDLGYNNDVQPWGGSRPNDEGYKPDYNAGKPEGNQPGYRPLTADDYANQPQLDYKPKPDELGITNDDFGYGDTNFMPTGPIDTQQKRVTEPPVTNEGKSWWERIKDTGSGLRDIADSITAIPRDSFNTARDVVSDIHGHHYGDILGDVGDMYKSMKDDLGDSLEEFGDVGKRTQGALFNTVHNIVGDIKSGDWGAAAVDAGKFFTPASLAYNAPYALFGQDTLGVEDPIETKKKAVIAENPWSTVTGSDAEEWNPDIKGHRLSDIPVVGNFAQGLVSSVGTAVRGVNDIRPYNPKDPSIDVANLEEDLRNGMSVQDAKEKYKGSPALKALGQLTSPDNFVEIPGIGEIAKGLHAETLGLKGGSTAEKAALTGVPQNFGQALKQSWNDIRSSGDLLGFAAGRARGTADRTAPLFDPQGPITDAFKERLAQIADPDPEIGRHKIERIANTMLDNPTQRQLFDDTMMLSAYKTDALKGMNYDQAWNKYFGTPENPAARPQRPVYEPVTDATPLAQELNQKTWYHGTPTAGLSHDVLDAAKTNEYSLYGRGQYLTDDPRTAATYANGSTNFGPSAKMYRIEPGQLNVRDAFDINAPVTPETIRRVNLAVAPHTTDLEGSALWELLQEAKDTPGITWDDVYRNPDDKLSTSIRDIMPPDTFTKGLLDAGYDAITHIGGRNMGTYDHRVVVPIDPNGKFFNAENPGVIRQFKDVTDTRKQVTVPSSFTPELREALTHIINALDEDSKQGLVRVGDLERWFDPNYVEQILGVRVPSDQIGELLRLKYPISDRVIAGMDINDAVREGLPELEKKLNNMAAVRTFGSRKEELNNGMLRELRELALDVGEGATLRRSTARDIEISVRRYLQQMGHPMTQAERQAIAADIDTVIDAPDKIAAIAQLERKYSNTPYVAPKGASAARNAVNPRSPALPRPGGTIKWADGYVNPDLALPAGSTKGNAPGRGQGLIADWMLHPRSGPLTNWWLEKVGFAPTPGVARDTKNSILSRIGEKVFTQPSLTRFDMAAGPSIAAKYLERANGSSKDLASIVLNPEMADTAQETRVLRAMNANMQASYAKHVEKNMSMGKTPMSLDKYAEGWFDIPQTAKGSVNTKALTKEAKKSGLTGTDLQKLIQDYVNNPDLYQRDMIQRLSTESLENKLTLIRAEQKNVLEKGFAAMMNGEANIKPGALSDGIDIARNAVKSGLLATSPRYYLQDTLDNALRALFDGGFGPIRTNFMSPKVAGRLEGVTGMMGGRKYVQDMFGTRMNFGETFGDFATGTGLEDGGKLSTVKSAASRAAETLDQRKTAIGKAASVPTAINNFLIGLSEPHERLFREAIWSRSFFPGVDLGFARLGSEASKLMPGNPDIQAFVAGLRNGTTTSYTKAKAFLAKTSLPPDVQARLARQVDSVVQQAAAKAFVDTQFSFNNYGLNIKFLDSASRALMPFSKYQTRLAPWIARTVAERPFLAMNTIEANEDLRSRGADGARKSTADKIFPGGGRFGINPLDVVPWNRPYDMLMHPPSNGQRPTESTDSLGEMVPGLQENQGMNNSIPARLLRTAIESGFAGTPYAPIQALGEKSGILSPSLAATTDQPSIDLLSNVTDKQTPGFDVLGHHIGPVNLGELAGNILSPAGLADRAVQKLAGTGSEGLLNYHIKWMMEQDPDFQKNPEPFQYQLRHQSGPLYDRAKEQALKYEQSSRNFAGTIPVRASELLPNERQTGRARAEKNQIVDAAQDQLDRAGRAYNQSIYTGDPAQIASAKSAYDSALSQLFNSFGAPGGPPSALGGKINKQVGEAGERTIITPTSITTPNPNRLPSNVRENPGFGEANADEHVLRQLARGYSPEAIALQDEQRETSKRYGSSTLFGPFIGKNDDVLTMQNKMKLGEANETANDILTGRIFNPEDRQKYLDYQRARQAYEGVMMDTPKGPMMVKDFLEDVGFYGMKDKDQRAKIAAIPQVKDYLTALQTANQRDQYDRLQLIKDDALRNPNTQKALFPITDQGRQSFNPRPDTPSIQQDRLYYQQWDQNKRDAFDAYNDLTHSADMVKLNALFDKAPKKGEPGYSEFYRANGSEIDKLENIRTQALLDIQKKTGYNPLPLVNESHKIFGYQPVKEDIPAMRTQSAQSTQRPSSTGGGSSSPSRGRSSSSSGSTSARSTSSSSSRQAGNDFFDFYRALTSRERAAVRNDPRVNAAVTGSDKSASAYRTALARAREILDSRDQSGATTQTSTSGHLRSVKTSASQVGFQDLAYGDASAPHAGQGQRGTSSGGSSPPGRSEASATSTLTDSFYAAYRDLPSNLKGVARNDRMVQAVLNARGKTDAGTIRAALTIVNDVAAGKRKR